MIRFKQLLAEIKEESDNLSKLIRCIKRDTELSDSEKQKLISYIS